MEEHDRTAQPKPRATPNTESKKEKGYGKTETSWVTASDQAPGKVTPTSQLHVTARNTVHNVDSPKVPAAPALYEFLLLTPFFMLIGQLMANISSMLTE